MDERSKRAQMERKRRIRRKKQRRRVLISALVEVLFWQCWFLRFVEQRTGNENFRLFRTIRQTACEGTGCDGSKQF